LGQAAWSADIFQTTGDPVIEHLNKLDEQLRMSKKPQASGGLLHDKWVLLIGTNKYQDRAIKPLKAARNSVMLIASTLKQPEFGHFANGHVAELTGSSATRDGILAAIFNSALCNKALPSDLIVIYFAGRTISLPNDSELCFCPYDTIGAEPGLSCIKLKETLARFRRRTQCANIVCILDCSPNNDAPVADCMSVDGLSRDTGVSVLSASSLGVNSQGCGSGTISCFAQYMAESIKDTQGYVSFGALAEFVQTNINNELVDGKPLKQHVMFAAAPGSERARDMMIGAPTRTPWAVNKVVMGHDFQSLLSARPNLLKPSTLTEPTVGMPAQKLENDGSSVCAKSRAHVGVNKVHLAKILNGQTPPDDDEPMAPGALDAYMAAMKLSIRQKWQPPRGLEEHRLVTTFTIVKDGSIVDPTVIESSGNPLVDQSAMDALKAASPLEPLPKGAPAAMQIRYVFDWHVSAK
jgi:TonB family protein